MLDTRMEEGQISVYDRLTFARSRNVGPQAIVAHSSCLRRSDNLNLANNQSTIYLALMKEVVECIFSWTSAAWIQGRRMSQNRSMEDIILLYFSIRTVHKFIIRSSTMGFQKKNIYCNQCNSTPYTPVVLYEM